MIYSHARWRRRSKQRTRPGRACSRRQQTWRPWRDQEKNLVEAARLQPSFGKPRDSRSKARRASCFPVKGELLAKLPWSEHNEVRLDVPQRSSGFCLSLLYLPTRQAAHENRTPPARLPHPNGRHFETIQDEPTVRKKEGGGMIQKATQRPILPNGK